MVNAFDVSDRCYLRQSDQSMLSSQNDKNSPDNNFEWPLCGYVTWISTTIQDDSPLTHFALYILKTKQNYKNNKSNNK